MVYRGTGSHCLVTCTERYSSEHHLRPSVKLLLAAFGLECSQLSFISVVHQTAEVMIGLDCRNSEM
jgi:hypothetical protein